MQNFRENQEDLRYRPYSVDRRPYEYDRPAGNDDRRPYRGYRSTYSQEKEIFGANIKDPRATESRYPRERDGRPNATQGSPYLQSGMRNLRPPSAGGTRERNSRFPGETVVRNPRPASFPRVRFEKYEETEEERQHFGSPKLREVPRDRAIGEINHQYVVRGQKRLRREQGGQESKNGERRSLSRGPRIPAPRRFVRSMQRR